jgi:hypothetical protein
MTRWAVEQVLALCPTPSRAAAGRGLATPSRWQAAGADDRLLWGRCIGSGAEPYETTVDHCDVTFTCTCPARAAPCKHAIGLLLLWVDDRVPVAERPAWATARAPSRPAPRPAPAPGADDLSDDTPPAAPSPPPADTGRDGRVERAGAALAELERWLTDRIRTGLGDPALGRYATWDQLAARLVDGRAGGLANRVRRVGGRVGASPEWHEHVLAELGILHLLARAGRDLASLDDHLADGVAVALGWQVRQADVLATAPDTDRWFVAGRSDALEDRIVVRRTWLWGVDTCRWAMVLSFAAAGSALDDVMVVGTELHADLHRYPGAVALRALVGAVHEPPVVPAEPVARLAVRTIAEACDQIGATMAAEPWLERVPVTLAASPAPCGRGWVLTDHTGSLPLDPGPALEVLVATSAGRSVVVTAEWSTAASAVGALHPVAVHLPERSLDVGPRRVEVWSRRRAGRP